jgi:hypothetical protein
LIALPNKGEHPKKTAFLAAYAECGVISRACKIADIGRTTYYDWMDSDSSFVAAFGEAHAHAVESMEAEARRRAIEGWDEPVFHEGSVCGYKRKFSDTLLIFMLKGAKPETYRDSLSVEGKHSITNQQINIYLPANGREVLTNGNGKH